MKQSVIRVEHLTKKFKVESSVGPFSFKNLLNKNYKEITAVNDISFDIYKEEFVAIIGLNGAGKTTILKCLTGLLSTDGGNIDVLGFNPKERKYEYLQKISLVMGHKSQLWWELPAIESFLLNKEIYQIEDKKYNNILDEMVEILSLESVINTPVRKLSLGERMKCELVASLLHTPELLFLDEPTIGLDIISQQKLRDFLKEYHRRYKSTIILTSHNMEDIKDLCKRVLVIDKGRIVYDGKLSDLTKRYVKEKYIYFVLSNSKSSVPSEEDIEEFGKIVEFNGHSGIISVSREDSAKTVSNFLRKFSVEDIDIQEPSLEDVVKIIFK